MKYLLIFILLSCSTSKYIGDVTVKQKEFEDIYLVTMKTDWQKYKAPRVAFLYRAEFCEKKNLFPSVIRYKDPSQETKNKMKMVFSCEALSKELASKFHISVKEVCLNDQDLPEINRAYCEHRKRQFGGVPTISR